jgi:hypothetical protein
MYLITCNQLLPNPDWSSIQVFIALVSGPDREYSHPRGRSGAWAKVNPAVIGSVQRKRSGPGLTDHLQEFLVLHRNCAADQSIRGLCRWSQENPNTTGT